MQSGPRIEGDVATKFQEGDTEFDMRVVLNRKGRSRASDVGSITLLNHSGAAGPARQVANVYFGKGPSEIQRKDRERLVTVASNLSGEVSLGQVVRAVARGGRARGGAAGGTGLLRRGHGEHARYVQRHDASPSAWRSCSSTSSWSVSSSRTFTRSSSCSPFPWRSWGPLAGSR